MEFINLINAYYYHEVKYMYMEFDMVSLDDWEKFSDYKQSDNLLMALGNCIYYKTHQYYDLAIRLGVSNKAYEFKSYCDEIAKGHTELLKRKHLKTVWKWLVDMGFIEAIYGKDKANSFRFKLKCKRFIREYFVHICISVYDFCEIRKENVKNSDYWLKLDFCDPYKNFRFEDKNNGMYPLNKFIYEGIGYIILDAYDFADDIDH